MFNIIENQMVDLLDLEKQEFLIRHHIFTHYPYQISLATDLLKEQMILSQKKFNLIFLDEIKSLSSLANANGISILFIKGVTLAKEIYSDPYNRLTGDVDILIKAGDLSRFLHIIDKFGGYKKFSFDIETEANRHISGRGSHFFPLEKEVYFEGVKYIFHVEIHTRLTTIELHEHDFVSIQDELKLTERIVDRARTFKLELDENKSIDIKIMDIYDSLIFLNIHMIKHLLWDLSRSTFYGRSHYFNIQLILDLINYWLKYKSQIKAAELLSRIDEFDVLNIFLLGIKIVKHFNQDFMGSVFNNVTLIETGNHSNTSKFVKNLYYLDVNDIVFLPSDVLVGKLLNSEKFINEYSENKNYQTFSGQISSLENEGVCYNSKGNKCSTDIKMFFSVECITKGLYFEFNVHSKDYVLESSCLNDMYLCDTIQLNILTNKANETGRYDNCYRICFENSHTGYLKNCSKKEWENITKKICSINVTENVEGYSAKLIIPWDVLGREYLQGEKLIINVGLHHYDINRKESFYLTHNNESKCFGYNSIYKYICIEM